MRNWIDLFEARFTPSSGIADDASMQDLLAPQSESRMMGREKGRIIPTGVSRLQNTHGATRYLYCRDGEPLSVLQLVSRDGIMATIANVYTVPDARRKGYAAELLNAARKDFKTIEHSVDLTQDGAGWANGVEGDS